MRRFTIPLTLLFCSAAFPQTPPSPPQLSPQSAYEQATLPLEITRRAIENWSDSETAALAVAIKQAKEQCSARTPSQYTGEDLIAYARLCALGQQWPTVQEAATLYVDVQHRTGQEAKPVSAFPGLAQAYAYLIDSSLHLNDSTIARVAADEMIRTVPYTDLTSQATNEVARYLQLIQTHDALTFLSHRQTVLLPLIRSFATSTPNQTQQPLPLHTIYTDALVLAALQQFTNDPKAAAATITELDAALPANLSADDSILIAESRRQYALLGTVVPGITTFAYLLYGSAAPLQHTETNFNEATALLLFPDWCAQCIHMGSQFMPAFLRLGQYDVIFSALLAQAAPPPAPASAKPKPTTSPKATHFLSATPSTPTDLTQTRPKTPVELLVNTPTFVVSNDTLKSLAVTDFPFLVVTDHEGIIRFLQPAPENVLVPGGLADQVIARVMEQWPAPSAK